jgi:DNA-binding NarL/FixJ family response regulator
MSEHPSAVRGKMRVVIGANDPATRAGIRLALAAEDIRVCAEASSVRDVVPAVQRHKPHVCLLDSELQGDVLQAVAEISVRSPSVGVVVLDDQDTDERFLEVMRVGANGYLDKRVIAPALANVVRAVVQGEPAVPRALVRALLNDYRDRGRRRFLAVAGGRDIGLTTREWDVLALMRDGLSTREIASRLTISEVTVRRHIGAVLKKLDVQSRAAALELLQSA